jgi:hypothetical protein
MSAVGVRWTHEGETCSVQGWSCGGRCRRIEALCADEWSTPWVPSLPRLRPEYCFSRVDPCAQEPFRGYTDLGGYPLRYHLVERRGEFVDLCAGCASKVRDRAAVEGFIFRLEVPPMRHAPIDVDREHVVYQDVFYEGAPYVCEECGVLVESAYGAPEGSEDAEEEA